VSDHLDRLRTALADRYTIERELGRGGMAVVYLANDVKHGRHVAVKVLLPELAATLGGDRFLQEIRVTAKLTHPHILTLIDSGEADGLLYYVMPYVEGESLRDRLKREKQLRVEDALRIAEQVASALAFAHRHEVIHRDIKPENILLHEGVAMVADFGIALAVKAAGGERLTETGLSIGTPEYMSPEQVAGERDIDARSDIYSLACVLYEMLAGQPPFTGATGQAVLARHVTDAVPPITTVRSGLSAAVAGAITKALGKAPADRFESAKVFSEALFAKTVQVEPEIKSIVVLPFENLSPEPDQEYFSDGLTEEVISDLSKIRSLRVISRSSAMTFKGSDRRIPDIASELNVRYALEGSVRKAGSSLRITAQLIDAHDDTHLWADKYTGTLDDVFDMQEHVSRAIVDALTLRLTVAEEENLSRRPIQNVAAYECHLRARAEVLKFTEEATLRALRFLQNGVDIIGDNALLYSTMGFAHWQLVNLGAEQEEHLARAHQCVNRALALDPDFPYAYAVLGWIGHLEGDFQLAASHLKKALALEPDDPFAIGGLLAVYVLVGKISAAELLSERLVQIDPLDFLTHFLQVFPLLYSGQLDRAVPLAHKLYEMHPEVPYSTLSYAMALINSGDHEAACSVIDQNAERNPDNALTNVSLVLKHAVKQDRDAAHEVMTPDFIKTSQRDCTFAHQLAGAFATLGETDEALNWLETAVNAGFLNYPMLAEHDPLLENIRSEERFKKLMVTVKEKWEEFEA
jgi:serine/threonine protein kinase/tetratricopeptide (TPR) repeat protein